MLRRSLVLFALLTLPAHAQEDADTLPPDSSRRVRYQDVTHIDLEIIDVEGTVVKPEVISIGVLGSMVFNPFFPLRANFDAEMEASVNEVR